jgi:hypothetical protein
MFLALMVALVLIVLAPLCIVPSAQKPSFSEDEHISRLEKRTAQSPLQLAIRRREIPYFQQGTYTAPKYWENA